MKIFWFKKVEIPLYMTCQLSFMIPPLWVGILQHFFFFNTPPLWVGDIYRKPYVWVHALVSISQAAVFFRPFVFAMQQCIKTFASPLGWLSIGSTFFVLLPFGLEHNSVSV